MITIFPTEHRKELWLAFKKKAQEENTDASKLFEKVIEEYLKAHASGNPTYNLDQHMKPGFEPYPTAWAPIGTKDLAAFDEKEEDQMILRLDAARTSIMLDRRLKHEKRLAEQVKGGKYAMRTTPAGQRTIQTSPGKETVL